jgi:hypothetical protein
MGGRMLTCEEIKDENWREELNKRFGWVSGGYLYVECLGGWRLILADMLQRIEAVLTSPEEREAFHISQCKQKWGELVCYHNGDERIDMIVEAAAAASRITCDICGGRGRVQNKGGWLSTRCTKHENASC